MKSPTYGHKAPLHGRQGESRADTTISMCIYFCGLVLLRACTALLASVVFICRNHIMMMTLVGASTRLVAIMSPE